MKNIILFLAFLSLHLSVFANEINTELIHRLDRVANKTFRAPKVCDIHLAVDTAASPPLLKYNFTGDGCKVGGISKSASCSPEKFKCGGVQLEENGNISMYGASYQEVKNTLYRCRCYLETGADSAERFILSTQFELQTGMNLPNESNDACDIAVQDYKSTNNLNNVTARGCKLVNP
jgi:hypothetical protein